MWLIYRQYSSPRTAVYRFRQVLVQEHCGSPYPLLCLFYAALVTMTIEARSDATSVVERLKAGAIVGFLVWGTADFIFYGNFNLSNLNATIADIVLEAVRGGIGGAVIAVVLSKIGN